jgi:translation initiation factor 3 subunit D
VPEENPLWSPEEAAAAAEATGLTPTPASVAFR